MTVSVDSNDFRTGMLSRRRCFVYVLPCAYEDILKLGHSRDPLARMQALHRRYFEFFDLEQAILIETETVREAQKLELKLAEEIKLHNAPAPLVVREQAGGQTEWYRGALDCLQKAADELSSAGYVVHRPAYPCLRDRLISENERLFHWSSETLLAIESRACPDALVEDLTKALRDALDAYAAFAIDLEPILPAAVYRWHNDQVADASGRRFR